MRRTGAADNRANWTSSTTLVATNFPPVELIDFKHLLEDLLPRPIQNKNLILSQLSQAC